MIEVDLNFKTQQMISQKHEKHRDSYALLRMPSSQWLIFFLILFLVCLSFTSIGQNLSFNNSVPAEINICGSSEDFTVEFTNLSSGSLTGVSIQITFPTGIAYEAGSLVESSAFNIQESDISNLSDITFSMSVLPLSATASFSFKAVADFPALAYHQAQPPYASGKYNLQHSIRQIT